MPQSMAQVYLHLIFSTKHRHPFLTDRRLRDETHKYLGGICNRLDCPVLRVGGVADHVHILCRLGRSIEIATLLREVKRESSKWLKAKSPALAQFAWQNGYGAFSISPSHVDQLIAYIENQEAHHRKESFQDEVRRVMKKYKLELDERHFWN
jgi:REP element-mobilizing transposase RayT